MQWINRIRQVKILLVVTAVVLSVASLVVSNFLVRDLKREEQRKMEIWAQALRSLNSADENTDLSLVLEVLNSNNTIPVIVVGGLRSREAIEQVLSKTGVAAVSLSRPLLFDPAFPNKLHLGEAEQSRCVSCNRCYSSPGHRCVMRGRL